MNTPHQIILTALAKMEEGEKTGKLAFETRYKHVRPQLLWENLFEQDRQDWITFAEEYTKQLHTPLLRELLKQACEALEGINNNSSRSRGPLVIAEITLSNIAQKLTQGDQPAVVRRGE